MTAGGTLRNGCRKVCDLRPAKKGRRLPRVLTTDEFRRFYQSSIVPRTCNTP